MSGNLFDPSWYRVADLKPRIRNQSRIHRHHYRGDLWYVLQDAASGKFHRFTPVGYQLIGLMDGLRTVQEIYQIAVENLGDEAPTQSEVIHLLGQLHSTDVLQCDVNPDIAEILERHNKQASAKLKQSLRSPLAIRIPLFDPDRILTKTQAIARGVFSWPMMAVWLAVVGAALTLAIGHWSDLTEDLSDRVLAPSNLVMLWLIFPVVKALHEFGHGMAVKAWEGEVHEMGIMFLVFMPVPYVDASAASAFRQRNRRIIVGAAGMMVEVFIASIALFLWLIVEPGLIHSILFNIMLIAGVSTVIFNANPLLRFDGYYMLADYLEIPNLANKSNQYIGYLIQKYLFRAESAETPVSAAGERGWLSIYSVISFFYRVVVYFSITIFVAGKYFIFGILLALWSSYSMLVSPVIKHVKFIFTNSRLREIRGRVVAVSASGVALLALGLFFAPFPNLTHTEGIVWIPDNAVVRAETEGFIQSLAVTPGEQVAAGQLIMRADDPQIELEERSLRAELEKLHAQERKSMSTKERVALNSLHEKITHVEGELDRLTERKKGLEIRAPLEGKYYINTAQDLPGRFVRKGQELGYVIHDAVRVVRAVVKQDRVDLVRGRTEEIKLRIEGLDGTEFSARLLREVPSVSNSLPSATLADIGGGKIAVDPKSGKELRAYENIYQLDLLVLEEIDLRRLGSRVYIRFDHGDEPLAFQIQRALRQLFLSHFNV